MVSQPSYVDVPLAKFGIWTFRLTATSTGHPIIVAKQARHRMTGRVLHLLRSGETGLDGPEQDQSLAMAASKIWY